MLPWIVALPVSSGLSGSTVELHMASLIKIGHLLNVAHWVEHMHWHTSSKAEFNIALSPIHNDHTVNDNM